MGNWRPGQKDAVIAAARARGMIEQPPSKVTVNPMSPEMAKEAEQWHKELCAIGGRPIHESAQKPKSDGVSKIKRRGCMNPVEAEFSRMLERRRVDGEFREWEFEAIKLHIGEGAYYTMDFCGRREEGKPVLFEIKGRHIVPRDVARIKVVIGKWRWLFDFEVWQKANGAWENILSTQAQ